MVTVLFYFARWGGCGDFAVRLKEVITSASASKEAVVRSPKETVVRASEKAVVRVPKEAIAHALKIVLRICDTHAVVNAMMRLINARVQSRSHIRVVHLANDFLLLHILHVLLLHILNQEL